MSLRAPVHIAAVPLIALFAVVTTARAQERATSLTGTVTTVDATQPIAGATVMVRGAGVGTTTNASGRFRLNELEAGNQSFEIWRDGYESMTVRVNLREGETCEIPAGLLELEAARTEYDQQPVASRRAIVERDQFHKWRARSVTEILHMQGGAAGAKP